MATFTQHTLETAGPARPLLEAAQKATGFIPNLYATMAEAPALLEGYLALSKIFDQSSFSPTERQIVLMTNNRLNGCDYCMAAHTTISQMQKVPQDVIDALRDGTSIGDAKLEALRVFAERVNLSRGWPEATDVDAFLDAGYTEQNILEVVLGTGLKVLSNYTNHVVGTPVDAAFAANAWTPVATAH